MTRTTFDGFKKVNGLRWQCEQCINDYTGIWAKLDELTSVVNEIKSLINLCGLVKSAISEAFRDHGPTTSPSNNNCPAATNFNSQPAVKRSIRRRGTAKKKIAISSTPLNSTVIPSSVKSQNPLAHLSIGSSIGTADNTIVTAPVNNCGTSHQIRIAESRTYLWISGFHHQTTTNQIINLVANTLNVEGSGIICRSLKSSRRTYTDFDQVSFRVGLKSMDLKDALTTNRWPKGVVCKLFNSKNYDNRQPVILD